MALIQRYRPAGAYDTSFCLSGDRGRSSEDYGISCAAYGCGCIGALSFVGLSWVKHLDIGQGNKDLGIHFQITRFMAYPVIVPWNHVKLS